MSDLGMISSINNGIDTIRDSKIKNLEKNKKLSQNDSDTDKIKKASQEFEAIFLEFVLKSMRDTVVKSDLLDGGTGEDIFRQMLDSEYAKVIASQDLTGISKNIEDQLLNSLSKTTTTLNKNTALKMYKTTP